MSPMTADKAPSLSVWVTQRPTYSIDQDPFNPINIILADLASCLTYVLCRDPIDEGFREAIQHSINASVKSSTLGDWTERVILDQLEARGATPEQMAAADFIIREEMAYKNTWLLADQFDTAAKLKIFFKDITRAAQSIHGFSLKDEREPRQRERKPRAALNLMDESPTRDDGYGSSEAADMAEDNPGAPNPEVSSSKAPDLEALSHEAQITECTVPEEAVSTAQVPVATISRSFIEEDVVEMSNNKAQASLEEETLTSPKEEALASPKEEAESSAFQSAAQDHGGIDAEQASMIYPSHTQATEAALVLRIGGLDIQTTEEDVLELLKGCQVASIRFSSSVDEACAFVELAESSPVQGIATLRRRVINGRKISVQWVYEQVPPQFPNKNPLSEWDLRSLAVDLAGENPMAPVSKAPASEGGGEVEIAERTSQGTSTAPFSDKAKDTARQQEYEVDPHGYLPDEKGENWELSDDESVSNYQRATDLPEQYSSYHQPGENVDATDKTSLSELRPLSALTRAKQTINAMSDTRSSKKTVVRSDEEKDWQLLIKSHCPTYNLLTDLSSLDDPSDHHQVIDTILESLESRWGRNMTEKDYQALANLSHELHSLDGKPRNMKVKAEKSLRTWVFMKPHLFPELIEYPFFINAFDIETPTVLDHLNPDVPLTADKRDQVLSAIMDEIRSVETPYGPHEGFITHYDGKGHDEKGLAKILRYHLGCPPENRKWNNGGVGIARSLEKTLRPFVFANREHFPEFRDARFVQMWEGLSGLKW